MIILVWGFELRLMIHSVTIATILRLAYLVRRVYYVNDDIFTAFQVELAGYAINNFALPSLLIILPQILLTPIPYPLAPLKSTSP